MIFQEKHVMAKNVQVKVLDFNRFVTVDFLFLLGFIPKHVHLFSIKILTDDFTQFQQETTLTCRYPVFIVYIKKHVIGALQQIWNSNRIVFPDQTMAGITKNPLQTVKQCGIRNHSIVCHYIKRPSYATLIIKTLEREIGRAHV